MSVKAKILKFESHGDIPDYAYAEAESILATLKQADPSTYEHCLRVGRSAAQLAKAAGLSPFEQKIAEFAGLLHDVGKLGVDPAIVHKPGRLTELEYRAMMMHSLFSVKMISHLEGVPFFDQVISGVRSHHERIDGRGYPDKLGGESIPLTARIVLVVDTLDAMTEDRPYRKGLPVEEVYKELLKYAGTQFDSALVSIFLQSYRFWKEEPHTEETLHLIVKKAA